MSRFGAFTVVGLGARTSNAREMTGGGDIGKLWGRLMGEGLLASIPARADDRILALYYDYESDKDGAYSFLLGAAVTSVAELPGGMLARVVSVGDYQIFAGEDSSPATVIGLWRQIWSKEKELQRAYTTDFEVYYPDQTVEIYVGRLAGNERTAPVDIPPSTNKV